MEQIKQFFNNFTNMQIVHSIIIIVVSVFLYRIVVHFINKSEQKGNSKLFTSNKSKTYIRFTRSITRYMFIIITLLIVLQANGVNVGSLLAGLGIASVVVGLAIQDWLKDIIRGSSILSDNYFNVGDIVKYNGIEGKVIVIGLKTTKIQDLKTSNVISIANRNIEQIEIVSNLIYINIPMPYETSIEDAEKVIKDILESIKTNKNVDGTRYLSVNEFGDSAINYLIEVSCNPVYKLQVRRDALRSILAEMNKNNISVPYTQIDIHEK